MPYGGYGGEGAFNGLDPVFASRLQAFLDAAHQAGFRIGAGSGYRSHEEQARLYRDYLNGKPGQARAAPPGRSKHNHGLAMDLDYEASGQSRQELVRWAHENAARFGLYFPMDDEDWHIQPVEDFEGQIPGGSGDQPWSSGIMYNLNYMDPTAAQNPQEVLANRLHSMLSVIGLDSVTASPGVTVQPVADPLMNVLAEEDAMAATGQSLPEAGARMVPGRTFGGVIEGSMQGPTGMGSLPAEWQNGVPPPGYEPPGEGVERWRPVALAALRYTGQPEHLVDVLLRRMAKESGGDPGIVNNWDSNAKRGDPSEGLMQNIRSAFPGRAKELAKRGIRDGFANMVASIRYSLGRYGSLEAAYNRRGGY